jgi:hypothetical protein
MLHRLNGRAYNITSFLVGNYQLVKLRLTESAGTAVLAQAGIWILAALVWAAVFMADEIIFFSYHPVSRPQLRCGTDS